MKASSYCLKTQQHCFDLSQICWDALNFGLVTINHKISARNLLEIFREVPYSKIKMRFHSYRCLYSIHFSKLLDGYIFEYRYNSCVSIAYHGNFGIYIARISKVRVGFYYVANICDCIVTGLSGNRYQSYFIIIPFNVFDYRGQACCNPNADQRAGELKDIACGDTPKLNASEHDSSQSSSQSSEGHSQNVRAAGSKVFSHFFLPEILDYLVVPGDKVKGFLQGGNRFLFDIMSCGKACE